MEKILNMLGGTKKAIIFVVGVLTALTMFVSNLEKSVETVVVKDSVVVDSIAVVSVTTDSL